MPRKPTGNVYSSAGKWYARVKIGEKLRPSIALPTCTSEEQAIARKDVLADLASKLRAAPHVAPDIARGLLERAAQRDGKALAAVIEAVDTLVRSDPGALPAALPGVPRALSPSITFQAFGELWTSGELARLFPDHVKAKRSVRDDVYRLDLHVYPVVGRVPLASFSLDDAQAVMRAMPKRSASTRRHVAQLMRRLLAIAVFPARLIAAHPLPEGFLPKVGAAKAKGWIYPDEDARLMACVDAPLCWRVLYGFLDREGPRLSEAKRLTFADVDLERGVSMLDENKTDDPRAWALRPDVVRALRVWRHLRGDPPPEAPVFVDESGKGLAVYHQAERFRRYLLAAKVDRAELFERSKTRQPIRVHDLRATFITLALANGRSETWVADRTGHKTSDMINRYRRAARTAVELGLGELLPLDEAIPELAAAAGGKGAGKGGDLAAAPSGAPGRSSLKRRESMGKESFAAPARRPLPATASGSAMSR
ncbi:tyrosine-type recombinase/integrase [Sorangium sp. So ce315]|uniref:tyrosine-type recombinase/integrase n=1 Tax=Sorangium sp. So ce315 TaxID=3133299 RepID=UPI003F5ECF24